MHAPNFCASIGGYGKEEVVTEKLVQCITTPREATSEQLAQHLLSIDSKLDRCLESISRFASLQDEHHVRTQNALQRFQFHGSGSYLGGRRSTMVKRSSAIGIGEDRDHSSNPSKEAPARGVSKEPPARRGASKEPSALRGGSKEPPTGLTKEVFERERERLEKLREREAVVLGYEGEPRDEDGFLFSAEIQEQPGLRESAADNTEAVSNVNENGVDVDGNQDLRSSVPTVTSSRAGRKSLARDVGLQALTFVNSRRRARSVVAEKVWCFIEDAESSKAAKWYGHVTSVLILFAVLGTILQTIEPQPLWLSTYAISMWELAFDCFLLVEFVVRLAICPNRRVFLSNVYNTIELIAILPLFVRIYINFEITANTDYYSRTALLCIVPILRCLKLLRRFQTFKLLLGAFEVAVEALPVIIFMLCLLILFFAAIVYICESREIIPTLPRAMWLTIVTMTTVGYGDTVPESTMGRLVISIVSAMGGLYMAMPFGIIGHAFTQVWGERDKILLYHKTRARMQQWGYTSRDIPVLFALYDSDNDGELSINDFRKMMHQMKIGLKDTRVVQLFQSMDADGGGSVDDHEFVRCLFPGDYHEIYGELDDNDDLDGDDIGVLRTTSATF